MPNMNFRFWRRFPRSIEGRNARSLLRRDNKTTVFLDQGISYFQFYKSVRPLVKAVRLLFYALILNGHRYRPVTSVLACDNITVHI